MWVFEWAYQLTCSPEKSLLCEQILPQKQLKWINISFWRGLVQIKVFWLCTHASLPVLKSKNNRGKDVGCSFSAFSKTNGRSKAATCVGWCMEKVSRTRMRRSMTVCLVLHVVFGSQVLVVLHNVPSSHFCVTHTKVNFGHLHYMEECGKPEQICCSLWKLTPSSLPFAVWMRNPSGLNEKYKVGKPPHTQYIP